MEVQKTAVNTRNCVFSLLEEFKVDVKTKMLVYVTDNGANMVAAFEGENAS